MWREMPVHPNTERSVWYRSPAVLSPKGIRRIKRLIAKVDAQALRLFDNPALKLDRQRVSRGLQNILQVKRDCLPIRIELSGRVPPAGHRFQSKRWRSVCPAY